MGDETRKRAEVNSALSRSVVGVHGLVSHALEFKPYPGENGDTHKDLKVSKTKCDL